jgi:hypothetical protein
MARLRHQPADFLKKDLLPMPDPCALDQIVELMVQTFPQKKNGQKFARYNFKII